MVTRDGKKIVGKPLKFKFKQTLGRVQQVDNFTINPSIINPPIPPIPKPILTNPISSQECNAFAIVTFHENNTRFAIQLFDG
jgi:hypothetical protein